MKILIVVRHAKAAWAEPDSNDNRRILDPQGVTDAEKLGQVLLEEAITPDIVLSSSAIRAFQTASIIVANLGLPNSIIISEDILYNASAETILSVIQSVDPSKSVIMLVAHNPGISNFVSLLTDGSPVSMGTCDAAIVELEVDSWQACFPGSGFLSRFIENY